jgi:AraC-like DNA-binding protein
VHGQSERFDVQLHWVGGHATAATLERPVARLEQLSYYPQLLARAAELHAQGEKLTAIAERLNAEGWHPAKRRNTFTAAMVHTLLAAQGLHSLRRSYRDAIEERAADEWTMSELAHRLAVPEPTLYSWLRRGELRSRQVVAAAHPLWLIQADEAELARLRALRERPRTWRH